MQINIIAKSEEVCFPRGYYLRLASVIEISNFFGFRQARSRCPGLAGLRTLSLTRSLIGEGAASKRKRLVSAAQSGSFENGYFLVLVFAINSALGAFTRSAAATFSERRFGERRLGPNNHLQAEALQPPDESVLSALGMQRVVEIAA